jgi:hypothetical protein
VVSREGEHSAVVTRSAGSNFVRTSRVPHATGMTHSALN